MIQKFKPNSAEHSRSTPCSLERPPRQPEQVRRIIANEPRTAKHCPSRLTTPHQHRAHPSAHPLFVGCRNCKPVRTSRRRSIHQRIIHAKPNELCAAADRSSNIIANDAAPRSNIRCAINVSTKHVYRSHRSNRKHDRPARAATRASDRAPIARNTCPNEQVLYRRLYDSKLAPFCIRRRSRQSWGDNFGN